MDDDDSVSEDELAGLRRRFSNEGVEWETQDWSSRTLHAWRWLVDAEANLKASRHIIDKLRRQHDEEKVELEEYTEHLRKKCEERVRELEDEVKELKGGLEELLAGTQAIVSMLNKEGLEDIAQSSLGEQIAYLLVERSRLLEDLEAIRKTPTSDREKDLTSQLIKVSTEHELLKHAHKEQDAKTAEMVDRVKLLERASRQLEVDNESLAYKLSEALTEIEDRESQLRKYTKNCPGGGEDSGPPSLRSLPLSDASFLRGDSSRRSFKRRESPRNSGRLKRSEVLRGRSPRNSGRRTKSEGKQINGTEDKKPVDVVLDSLDRNDSIVGYSVNSEAASPNQLHSLLEEQIQTSRDKIDMIEDIKKLKSQMEKLKRESLESGDKYEMIIRKYELYKIKTKTKINSVKQCSKEEIDTLKRRVTQLEGEVTLHLDHLQAEETLRAQLEKDLESLRQERQEMTTRVTEAERKAVMSQKEQTLLQEKVQLIQKANKQLNQEVQDLTVAATVG
ncbi:uncharacterized protein LOC143025563 [Oratosquilla oratoria]|uniref:uncharacterized protein LOC143025563 n=1 Tax=Oratosquilla oratoria TaxID=337810 RepID=UPI003F75887F